MGRKVTTLFILLVLGGSAWFLWSIIGTPDQAPAKQTPVSPAKPPELPKPSQKKEPTKLQVGRKPVRPVAAPVNQRGTPTSIMGRVSNIKGDPIDGAVVDLLLLPFNRERFSKATGRIYMDNSFTEDLKGQTTTGKDGSYEFKDLVPRNKLYIRASAPGFVPQFKDSVEVGYIANFVLERGTHVTGRVLDRKTGQPVAQARVKGWFRTPGRNRSIQLSQRWKENVITGKDGKFSFAAVPARLITFMVFQDEYEDLQEKHLIKFGTMSPLVFKIEKGLVVKGRVTDKLSGKQIPGARVELVYGFLPRYRTRTDQNGLFTLKSVLRGKPQSVNVSKRGYTAARKVQKFGDADAFDSAKKNYLEILVDPCGSASGIVQDSDGSPIPNAQIFVARKTPLTYTVRDRAESITDAEGRFTVGNLGANQVFRIAAHVDGNIPAVSKDVTVGPAESRDGVLLKLQSGSAIRGRVIDENGAPVADATVTCAVPPFSEVWFPPGLGLGQQTTHTKVTGPDGRYEFPNLWAGSYSLQVEHPEHVSVTDSRIRIRDEHSVVNRDFTLKIGRFIEGRVVMADGSNAKGAVVEAYRPMTSSVAGRAVVDENGLYRISELVTGRYRVQAKKDNFTSKAKRDVDADSSEVNFQLVPAARVMGTVMSTDGSPVTRFQLELLSEETGLSRVKASKALGGYARRFSNPAGQFSLEAVDPGLYTLKITGSTHMDYTRHGVAIQSGVDNDLGIIRVEKGATLSGIVASGTGQPVTNARIMLLNQTLRNDMRSRPREARGGDIPRMQWTATTEGNGHYLVGGLAPGQYELRVTAKDYAPPPPQTFTLERESSKTLNLTLDRAGQVVLKIVDDYDTPVVSAMGQVFTSGRNRRAIRTGRSIPRSNGKGEMTISNLAQGSYIVRLRRSGMTSREVPIEIQAGRTLTQQVQMEHTKR